MKMLKIVSAPLLATALLAIVISGAAHADPAACDRACLKGLADRMVDSMVAHDAATVPLTRTYRATENDIPAALGMMVAWRVPTGAAKRFYIIDPVSHQLYLIVTLSEGPNTTLLFGRIKAEGRQLSEVEIFENRGRGQGGFQYSGDGVTNMPVEWTQDVAPGRLPSRNDLIVAGRSLFDTSLTAPASSLDCVLMENGKAVEEDAGVAAKVGGGPAGPKPKGKAFVTNPNGSVPIPCGSPDHRPTDPKARTDIIDTDQGIVVSEAVVNGAAEPYLVTTPTLSAFVPDQILEPYTGMLQAQQASGTYNLPELVPMGATGMTAHLLRIYDGQIQGMQLLINLAPRGAHSPWVP